MPFTKKIKISKWWLLVPFALLVMLMIGCIIYLFASRNTLSDWYLDLYPCIYKHSEWTSAFFTPRVKQSGNIYCLIGIGITALLSSLILIILKRSRPSYQMTIAIQKQDIIVIAALYAFALIIWLYGFFTSYPAYDEVFSAVNCAGIHPFQTVSYYMLPNNHVFFNFLNSIFFHWATNKVITGRIISGVSLAILIPILYYWLYRKTRSRIYASVFCAVLLLQFPVWAFSFQARGYALYLLCAWTAFISLEAYLCTHKKSLLILHCLATTIGFATLPSYLFWEAAIVVMAILFMIWKKIIDRPLIITHLISGCLIFLFFLPLLCFSGLASVTENRYVKVTHLQSVGEFLPALKDSILATIQYCFSGRLSPYNISYIIMFVIPFLCIPFIRKSKGIFTLLFAILAWIMVWIIVLRTQSYPFMRNLIAHFSFTLACLFIACFLFLQQILENRYKILRGILTAIILIPLSIHFISYDKSHIHSAMYFYDVDIGYTCLQDALRAIPKGAHVGLSDEGFYWEFMLHNRGIAASMCMGTSANYYIKTNDSKEQLPLYLEERAELWKVAEHYNLYRIRADSKIEHHN